MDPTDGTRPGHRYEVIGRGYAAARRADPRVESQILAALGPADGAVVNVGAGTGNYEPVDRPVVAVEPSPTMLTQHHRIHPVVRAVAERLPFPNDAFATAMAIFTVHHWTDRAAGLAELGRVSRRQVCLVYDVEVTAHDVASRLLPRTGHRAVGDRRPERRDHRGPPHRRRGAGAVGLESGEWDRVNGHLRRETRFDMGYRLVLSHRP